MGCESETMTETPLAESKKIGFHYYKCAMCGYDFSGNNSDIIQEMKKAHDVVCSGRMSN